MSGIFVDTNILVYAHDKDAGARHEKARELVRGLWLDQTPPAISIQVLQELYVNLIRKKIPAATANEIIEDYMQWNVIDNTKPILTKGIDFSIRFHLSFWDALIIAAAESAEADELWSEDLQTGATIEGIHVVNPLR
ncbi:MAG: PIN domain-containing protein [Kiritimatiellia bacterium]|jgi:predicted nucleic acid-binding protein